MHYVLPTAVISKWSEAAHHMGRDGERPQEMGKANKWGSTELVVGF